MYQWSDPGVGSRDRRSIACLTYSGHYIITPDNGSLSHIKHYEGIKKVIEIDEVKSRLPRSEESHTFMVEMFMHTMERVSCK